MYISSLNKRTNPNTFMAFKDACICTPLWYILKTYSGKVKGYSVKQRSFLLQDSKGKFC